MLLCSPFSEISVWLWEKSLSVSFLPDSMGYLPSYMDLAGLLVLQDCFSCFKWTVDQIDLGALMRGMSTVFFCLTFGQGLRRFPQSRRVKVLRSEISRERGQRKV